MVNKSPPPDQVASAAMPPGDTQGDHITVGNIDHSINAIGRGAYILYQQALSRAEEARQEADREHELLFMAVSSQMKTLYEQMRNAPPADSPYKYLLPFEFSDAGRFFGRDAFRDEVLQAVHGAGLRCRLVVLHGDAGMGKTSLLRASVAPALVAEGHLPLLVRVSHEPVADRVKKALLRDLTPFEGLRQAPLCEFLHQVSTLLPEGKQVYVLVDQFEEFLELPPTEQQQFTEELAHCMDATPPIGHWLLSIQTARAAKLSSLEPTIPHPLANTLEIPPLTASQAREAILKPAGLSGLQVDERLVDVLLQDLGRDAIDPSKLQLVCHTLAQSAKSGEKALRLTAYEKAGRAEAILRDHLKLVLEHNLPLEDAEDAWRVLAVIAAHPRGAAPEVVLSELKTYRVGREKSLRVLGTLEVNRLIRLHDQVYRLTSAGLLEPIRQWKEQQAAREQARIEARRQLERVRNSALRGLFGGGGAFTLAYLLTYYGQTIDWQVLALVSLFEGLVGGIAGIFFLFALDVAQASFHGRLRRIQVLWGGLAGAALFSTAFLVHKLLHFQPDVQILYAAIEGGIWGLVAGSGTAVVLLSRRPFWQTIPPAAALSALALWLGEMIGKAYHRPRIEVGGGDITLLVLLAGALMFLSLTGATIWGKQREAGGQGLEAQPKHS